MQGAQEPVPSSWSSLLQVEPDQQDENIRKLFERFQNGESSLGEDLA